MDIKEFIVRTMEDIVEGLNTSSDTALSNNYKLDANGSKIDFDIAVTTTETTGKDKKVGLNKVVVAGVGKNSEKFDSTVS